MPDSLKGVDPNGRETAPSDGAGPHKPTISPLPGELGIPNLAAAHRTPMAKKGLVAAALLIGSLVAGAAATLQRLSTSTHIVDVNESRLARDKPAAATSEPRKLEIPAAGAQSSEAPSSPRIPALTPTAEELQEPIGVRRSGSFAATSSSRTAAPEDAPVMLITARPGAAVSGQTGAKSQSGASADENPMPSDASAHADDSSPAASRDLRDYQRRLQGVLEGLTSTVAMASTQLGEPQQSATPGLPPSPITTPSGAGVGNALFGGELHGSSTPTVSAAMLGHRSLTLPKGTAFTCALKTKIITASAGLVGCEVQRNLYSDDGRVLLVERGAHLDGEYRVTSLRPGSVRIPVLWTRMRTPSGVTADLASPGTGQLGESGIDGDVDKRWTERIGAALMLSLIDDSVKLVIQNQANERQADTIVLPSTTANASKLAEKVLDSTINIPPLIYQNQGGIVGIYVARDIDFSTVYELVPAPTGQQLTRPPTQPHEATP
ncbi:MAG: type IV secretion system protein VirB10 [Paucibacter sp.]|nr:type IV secretion system protein VirB10 [Roseateles sp.]